MYFDLIAIIFTLLIYIKKKTIGFGILIQVQLLIYVIIYKINNSFFKNYRYIKKKLDE